MVTRLLAARSQPEAAPASKLESWQKGELFLWQTTTVGYIRVSHTIKHVFYQEATMFLLESLKY